MLNWKKSKSEKNLIYSLYDKNEDISTGTYEVLVTNKKFYSDLYKKEGVDTTLQNKILEFLNTKLSNVWIKQSVTKFCRSVKSLIHSQNSF